VCCLSKIPIPGWLDSHIWCTHHYNMPRNRYTIDSVFVEWNTRWTHEEIMCYLCHADIRCTQFVIKFKSKLRNLLLRPMGQLTYPRSLCHQLELYYSNDDSKSFYYICLCYVHHGLSVGHSLDKLLRKPPPQGGGSTPPT
jgi:hypothetical protein